MQWPTPKQTSDTEVMHEIFKQHWGWVEKKCVFKNIFIIVCKFLSWRHNRWISLKYKNWVFKNETWFLHELRRWRFQEHYVKSVQTRSFFWSVLSCIWIEYGDLRSVFSPKTGKYGSEKTPYLDTFQERKRDV